MRKVEEISIMELSAVEEIRVKTVNGILKPEEKKKGDSFGKINPSDNTVDHYVPDYAKLVRKW